MRVHLGHVNRDIQEAFFKALTKARVYLKRHNHTFPLATIEPPRDFLLTPRTITMKNLWVAEVASYGRLDATGKVDLTPLDGDITNLVGELRHDIAQDFI